MVWSYCTINALYHSAPQCVVRCGFAMQRGELLYIASCCMVVLGQRTMWASCCNVLQGGAIKRSVALYYVMYGIDMQCNAA